MENTTESMTIKESIELLLINHQQIHENIKFADQKAGAVATANGALLALTYTQIEPHQLPTIFAAGFLVAFALAIAIGFTFLVVKPRGEANRDRGPGVIDAIRIALYSHDQFQSRLAQMDDRELLIEVRTFIYDRARIDSKKYFYLRISLIISLIAWVAALLFFAAVKIAYLSH